MSPALSFRSGTVVLTRQWPQGVNSFSPLSAEDFDSWIEWAKQNPQPAKAVLGAEGAGASLAGADAADPSLLPGDARAIVVPAVPHPLAVQQVNTAPYVQKVPPATSLVQRGSTMGAVAGGEASPEVVAASVAPTGGPGSKVVPEVSAPSQVVTRSDWAPDAADILSAWRNQGNEPWEATGALAGAGMEGHAGTPAALAYTAATSGGAGLDVLGPWLGTGVVGADVQHGIALDQAASRAAGSLPELLAGSGAGAPTLEGGGATTSAGSVRLV